jgi:hypothetical protein
VSRDFLISRLSPQVNPNFLWEQNVEHYILLVASVWYLQRKGVFEGDPNYILTNFRQITKSRTESIRDTEGDFCAWFHGLIKYLFGEDSPNASIYLPLPRFGSKILNNNLGFRWTTLQDTIFEDCLLYDPMNSYKEKKPLSIKKPTLASDTGLPVLNLLLLQEQTTGFIEEFAIGALFEKILTEETKKSTGAYYTPKNICDFIAEEALSPILFPTSSPFWNDNWGQRLEKYKKALLIDLKKGGDESFKTRFHRLHRLRILDPAVGSGHFLASIIDKLIDVYRIFWIIVQEVHIRSLVQFTLHAPEKVLEIDFQQYSDFNSLETILRAFHVIPNMLYAIDINPFSVLISKIRLLLNCYSHFQRDSIPCPPLELNLSLNIKTGNSLYGFDWSHEFSSLYTNHPNEPFGNAGIFDLIIGNPPYGNLLTQQEKHQVSEYAHFPNEISAVFIDLALNLLDSQGNLVFITSYAICFSKDLSATRLGIAKLFEVSKIATFDRDKCRFFEGMTQSVSILQCIRKKDPQSVGLNTYADMYTTNMYRSMPELSELAYEKANGFLLVEKAHELLSDRYEYPHRLPKIGECRLSTLLRLFKNHHDSNISAENTISVGNFFGSFKIVKNSADDMAAIKELGDQNFIYLRISGNYWYNALDRAPYYGTQIAILPLLKTTIYHKNFFLTLINSSLFYTWFRIYSDGRHLNGDILRAFPMPAAYNDIIVQYGFLVDIYAQFLLNTLFDHFDAEYNRFKSSEIKAMIDVGDLLLGEIYGLPQEISDFCVQFESVIRGGEAITPKEKQSFLLLFQIVKGAKKRQSIEASAIEFKEFLSELQKRLKK